MEAAQITIAGTQFSVTDRYEEGHELTAGEASALNQTYRENIRNNLASKVKEGTCTQVEVDAYAKDYQFGVRTPGTGRTSDPVMAEFLRLAKDKIRKALAEKGKKADADQITEAAKALATMPRGAELMELARRRVAEAQSIAASALDDLIAGIPEKAPEAQAAA